MKMRLYIICALLVGYGRCDYVKYGVKGGAGGHRFQEHAGESLVSLFGNKTHHGYPGYSGNQQGKIDVGVCMIEVPTASLVRDQSHVPTGNGSRPDLSVIRTCCKGYIRNIHNPSICEPFCATECVNALCTAPDTCTCFPDHVRNLAGFCVSICPIGCQNGHCSGGECICNEGYKLDFDGMFCVPKCSGNCGSNGNCTAPNTCSCKPGYQTSADGSCHAVCTRCTNGDCVSPNYCQCHHGYVMNERGECTPHCSIKCRPDEQCVAPETCANPLTYTPNNAQIHTNSFNQSIYSNGYPIYSGYQNIPINQNRPNYPYPNYNRQNYSATNITDNIYNSEQSQYNHQTQYLVQHSNNPSKYPSSASQLANATRLLNYTPNYSTNQANTSTNPVTYVPQNGNNYPHTLHNQPGYGNVPVYQGYPVYSHQTSYPNQWNVTSQFPMNNPNPYGNPYYPGNSYYPNQPNYANQPINPYLPNYSTWPVNANQPNSNNQTYNLNQRNQTYPNNYPYQPIPYQPFNSNLPVNPGSPYYSNSSHQQPANYPNQPYNPNYQPNYSHQPQYPQGQHPFQTNSTFMYQPNLHHPNQSHPRDTYYYLNEYGLLMSQTNYPSSNQGAYGSGQSTPQFPVCSEPCINGVCVEGNKCVCNPGYGMDPPDLRCKPRCPGGCPNGVCSAPNLCICNMGYHKDTSVKGRAVCVKRIRRSLDFFLSKKSVNISKII